MLRRHAAHASWLGIVTPGELLMLNLTAIFADDAPRDPEGRLGVGC
jgi:hypothetical protein